MKRCGCGVEIDETRDTIASGRTENDATQHTFNSELDEPTGAVAGRSGKGHLLDEGTS